MSQPSSTVFTRKTFYRLLLISLVVELLLFAYNIFEERKYEPQNFEGTHFAYLSGDAHSYFEPINSLIDSGVYESNSIDAGFSKFGRTPHYGMVYGFFRLFFEQKNALDAVILFQLLLRIISAVVFFRIVERITKNQIAAWIGFLLFVAMSTISIHAYRIMTESLSMSFFIFCIWYFLRWRTERKIVLLLLSGLFAGYIMAMRPFLMPVFGVLALLNFYYDDVAKIFLQKFRNIVFFFVPFVIVLAPWTIRNYNASGKFIPLQEDVNAGYYFSDADLSLRYFLTATGENFMSWDWDAAGSWFDPYLVRFSKYKFPETVLCKSVTMERLETARDYYQSGILNKDSIATHKADSMFVLMRNEFIEERPFYYRVVAPLRILKRAYVYNGVEVLERETWYELAFKTVQALLFVMVCIGFVLSVFVKPRLQGFLWTVPVVLGIFLCLGFRFSEHRYFIYAYPVFILYAAAVFAKTGIRWKLLKR